MTADEAFLPPTAEDAFGRVGGAGATRAELAGFWQRAGASILDGIIVGVAAGVLSALGAAGGDAAGAITLVLLLAVSLLYAPLLMARKGGANGQTLGKQALGIRVAREDGQPVSFGTGAVREIVGKSLLGIIVIPTLASIVMVAVRADKKAIWDLLAGTRVVRG